MQPFNRLAGVEEATNTPFPPPPPIPNDDPEQQTTTTHSLHSRPSRASLPPNRKPSRRTLHDTPSRTSLRPPSPNFLHNQQYTASANSRDDLASQYTENELAWGPLHPCFPHLNPHVAVTSKEYADTRIIRIQRDWLVSGDLYPSLQNLYPEILAEHLSEADFRTIIETLNPMLQNALDPNTAGAWLDAILGVMTGFLWDNLGFGWGKRRCRDIEKWVDGWNVEARREGREVRLVDLRRTGFMTLDIQIPDPRVDVVDGDLQSF